MCNLYNVISILRVVSNAQSCLEKCVCWRRQHNVLERKCTKSGGKSQYSLSFLSSSVNDVRRKVYTVGTHSTVGKRAKRMTDPTVETKIWLRLLTFCKQNSISSDVSMYSMFSDESLSADLFLDLLSFEEPSQEFKF